MLRNVHLKRRLRMRCKVTEQCTSVEGPLVVAASRAFVDVLPRREATKRGSRLCHPNKKTARESSLGRLLRALTLHG